MCSNRFNRLKTIIFEILCIIEHYRQGLKFQIFFEKIIILSRTFEKKYILN